MFWWRQLPRHSWIMSLPTRPRGKTCLLCCKCQETDKLRNLCAYVYPCESLLDTLCQWTLVSNCSTLERTWLAPLGNSKTESTMVRSLTRTTSNLQIDELSSHVNNSPIYMATNLDQHLRNLKYHQSTCLVIQLYRIENTLYITLHMYSSCVVMYASFREELKRKEGTKNTLQEPATESKHIESCNLCLQRT
jgi:hypothetical protein